MRGSLQSRCETPRTSMPPASLCGNCPWSTDPGGQVTLPPRGAPLARVSVSLMCGFQLGLILSKRPCPTLSVQRPGLGSSRGQGRVWSPNAPPHLGHPSPADRRPRLRSRTRASQRAVSVRNGQVRAEAHRHVPCVCKGLSYRRNKIKPNPVRHRSGAVFISEQINTNVVTQNTRRAGSWGLACRLTGCASRLSPSGGPRGSLLWLRLPTPLLGPSVTSPCPSQGCTWHLGAQRKSPKAGATKVFPQMLTAVIVLYIPYTIV